MKQERAKTVEDFVRITSKVRSDWRLDEVVPWFRGQGNAEWSLMPKFYRQQNTSRDYEDEVREDFVTRAPALSETQTIGHWDWYFLMQHYGAPTRLLDWTEGALIALYFAVKQNSGCHDAAVWVLDPWELNKKVVKQDWVVPPGEPGTSARDRRLYDRWLPGRFARGKRWPRRPAAIYPGHIVRRIGAQRSCFTIHGSERRGLEDIAETSKIPLMKIVIPSWEVAVIRRSLETCGLDETTIFPDLEGLGKAVEMRWTRQDPALPHRGAYTRLAPSKVDKTGVGVIAIRKIRKGTALFGGDEDEMVWVKKTELPRAPKSLRRLYDDFAVVKTEDGVTRYGCPTNFNRLTVSWYLNRSRRPNVRCDASSYDFFALRDIEPGEELTVDYPAYSE